jgi:glycosyltransferase involved in cell wall biosynthesis
MRIAQLAPLIDTVAPRGVAPLQRLIHHLVEALTDRGHDVTLFAGVESQTRAKLHALPSISASSNRRLQYASKVLLFERGLLSDASFDVIHSHLDCLALPFARRAVSPVVTTVYDALECSSTADLYGQFNELALVSDSERQRAHVPAARWMATIYPGLPEDSLRFRPDTGDYLAYLGPVSSTTFGPSLLSLAHDTGIPFRVAGSMPPSHHDAEQLIRDMKRHDIEYLGEITQADEEEFIGSALAVILPEGNRAPSSLTTVEALACGTPVVTVAAHVDAELIEHGITGFVCPHSHDIASAVKQIDRLDRHHCRDAFEANFTLDRMVEEYLKVYTMVVKERVF